MEPLASSRDLHVGGRPHLSGFEVEGKILDTRRVLQIEVDDDVVLGNLDVVFLGRVDARKRRRDLVPRVLQRVNGIVLPDLSRHVCKGFVQKRGPVFELKPSPRDLWCKSLPAELLQLLESPE